MQESWRKGLTLRPDLLQSRVDLERRDIILRYQKNQIFPQLDLVGSYGQVADMLRRYVERFLLVNPVRKFFLR